MALHFLSSKIERSVGGVFCFVKCAGRFVHFCIATLCVLWLHTGNTQTINPELLSKRWEAQWITHPAAGLKAYEVFHFRKTVALPAKPQRFVVHLTADSRYKFYVNGKLIGLGPARSDLQHWYFDTYDLAPYLQTGNNTLAAMVWNQGEWNALAQHSYRTGFLLQGDGKDEALVNTNEGWKVYKNEAYAPVVFKPVDPRLFWQYYVAGALDSVQGQSYPWHWEEMAYNDNAWSTCKTLGKGTPNGPENATMWDLMPRPVAYLEQKPQRFEALRESSGIVFPNAFPANISAVIVPANTTASFLLDTKYEVTGYPQFIFSKGKSSTVKISYAETLLDIEKDNPYKWHKTNRDSVDGKKFVGTYDVFQPDGGESRTFVPLWMRVFRYVLVEIKTADEPLVLNDVSYDLVWYPFQMEASFVSSDPVHEKIVDACLRTVRLASQETYIDPYYEQMQYIGDTRIESLYASYHFRDDRLTRNAISQFNWSRSPEGITMSRYPSSLPQYTPLFALCWMLMVNDYWMMRGDEAFVQQFISGMLGVLEWYKTKINSEGLLGDLPYLDFLDSHYDRDKILNASKSKSLTPYSLFYVYTVQQLAPFFQHFGKKAEALYHQKIAEGVKQAVTTKCFDKRKNLFAENPEKKFFSQHSNILAVLTDCVPASQQKTFMQKVLSDTSLIPVSLYFKFYQFAALKKAGMGGEILHQLGDWETMLSNGMHTFSEWLVDPRSECHSWSAYPSYYFLNTIAGIGPAAPGFAKVLIEPNPGDLTYVQAAVPHPAGIIKVLYQKSKNGNWNVVVDLPEILSGTLKWKGKSYVLKGGQTRLQIPF